jgi:hypothetical protein
VSSIDSLAGKAVLVTGGSRGIGRAITLGFAERGCHVTFCYRSNQAAANETVAAALARGYSVEALRVNVADSSAVQQMVDDLLVRRGRIDVLGEQRRHFPPSRGHRDRRCRLGRGAAHQPVVGILLLPRGDSGDDRPTRWGDRQHRLGRWAARLRLSCPLRSGQGRNAGVHAFRWRASWRSTTSARMPCRRGASPPICCWSRRTSASSSAGSAIHQRAGWARLKKLRPR